MVGRVMLQVVLIISITIVLAWLVLSALALPDSADPVGTLVEGTPRVLFGLLGIALGLWSVLVTIGAIAQRRRAAGWRIATHLVSLVAALVVNVGLLAVVSVASGGGSEGDWGMLVVVIAVGAGGVLLATGAVSVLLVELLLMRQKKPADPVWTPPVDA
jgi:Kef-type K+ transport system membrane component KefB